MLTNSKKPNHDQMHLDLAMSSHVVAVLGNTYEISYLKDDNLFLDIFSLD